MKKIVMGLCLIGMSGGSGYAVSVNKDSGYVNTVVLESFGGVADPSSKRNHVDAGSLSGGLATYKYQPGVGPEGYVTFASSYDAKAYPYIRSRMAVDRNGKASTDVQLYPSPTGKAGMVVKNASSKLKELQFDLSALTADGTGFRFDPFNYANDPVADTWSVDYVMADRSLTRGAEFDHDGDTMSVGTLGMTSSVSNGVLTGTSANGDSQIMLQWSPDFTSANADVFKFVQIRMKGTAGDAIDLFWKTSGSARIERLSLEKAADGEYHTYLIDFSDQSDWKGVMEYLRLDPNTKAGGCFEVDYVRLIASISEPAAAEL